ncbi:putative peptide alpha-N-acetyltransferase Nat2 [Rosellinia necatrix]|uniref:Putative peptide alpha-N-acetyltransferase Nat2 n=1 Tax=Rosellinia necatrix TaxID=77044 RepID=A0A1S7UN04_ROSNE|nr:putative peptide alpha-N-acetyltransferase Nat2 [Rosellinia necatrix]
MMIRTNLRTLRPFLQPSRNAVGLRNALRLETQPLQRTFNSISQSAPKLPFPRVTHRINYRSRSSNPINKLYQSPLRTNKRSFHRSPRLRDSKPNSSKPNTEEPQGLSARLKKLSREYGWAAVGVYLGLSVLDFPFCFLLVRVVGTDRIGELEHWLVSHATRVIPESVRNRWTEYREAYKAAKQGQPGDAEEAEVAGWGVEEAEQRNKTEASLGTQLALAYAIHKSFIFLRVPLTAAVTPKVVKVLRSWGWNIGKRRAKR